MGTVACPGSDCSARFRGLVRQSWLLCPVSILCQAKGVGQPLLQAGRGHSSAGLGRGDEEAIPGSSAPAGHCLLWPALSWHQGCSMRTQSLCFQGTNSGGKRHGKRILKSGVGNKTVMCLGAWETLRESTVIGEGPGGTAQESKTWVLVLALPLPPRLSLGK